jgi:hypothetical protein
VSEEHVWQPGEKAVYRFWRGSEPFVVTILRYSRGRNGEKMVLVKRNDGRRFTTHVSKLTPVVGVA